MGHTEQAGLVQRHRVTVDEYHRMAEAGVLAPDARVELIEGEVVDMASIGTRHASTVKRLNRLFLEAAGARAIVSVQDPLRLGDMSEPEPDLMLLRPRDDWYASNHPTATDVLLLVEVSETSVRYDREIKIPLYARHGVQEVWIVDVDDRVVRFFRRPRDGAYADITATETPGPTAPQALPDAAVDLATLFR
jgi:Uma2 family endonuclease